MSARSALKIIYTSIVVQKTTSWNPVPRSRLWSYPRAVVLQQLLLRNPWKNRE